ncbi:MAG: hypothetical protein WCA56_20870, partial [Xanthobacteraceae bacterium]
MPWTLYEDRATHALRRRRSGWLVIGAAAIVFAALAFGGALPVAFAIAGFAIVAAAAVLALRTGKDDARLAA